LQAAGPFCGNGQKKSIEIIPGENDSGVGQPHGVFPDNRCVVIIAGRLDLFFQEFGDQHVEFCAYNNASGMNLDLKFPELFKGCKMESGVEHGSNLLGVCWKIVNYTYVIELLVEKPGIIV
jgi:hypothetical protein